MSQTERSWADVQALITDNTVAAISPQDVRDAFASTQGFASMLLSVPGAPQTVFGVGTGYSLLDIFDVISGQSSAVNSNGSTAVLSPDYRITWGSTGFYFVSFFASFSSSDNNHLITFRPHVNGAPGLVEVDRFVGTGSDVGVVAFNGVIPYTAGDYVDMRVKIDSGTSDLEFLAAGFCGFRVG